MTNSRKGSTIPSKRNSEWWAVCTQERTFYTRMHSQYDFLCYSAVDSEGSQEYRLNRSLEAWDVKLSCWDRVFSQYSEIADSDVEKNNFAAYAYLHILVLESFTVGSPGELHVRTYRSTRTYYPYITKPMFTQSITVYIPTSHKHELNSYCRELYLVSWILVLWMLFYSPHKIHLPYPSSFSESPDHEVLANAKAHVDRPFRGGEVFKRFDLDISCCPNNSFSSFQIAHCCAMCFSRAAKCGKMWRQSMFVIKSELST